MENPSSPRRALHQRERRRKARHPHRTRHRPQQPPRSAPHLLPQRRPGPHRRRLRPQLRHRDPLRPRRPLRSAPLRRRHSLHTLRPRRPRHRVPCLRLPRPPRPHLLRQNRRRRPMPRLPSSRKCSLNRRACHRPVRRLLAVPGSGNACATDNRVARRRRMPRRQQRQTPLRPQPRMWLPPRGPDPADRPRCRPARPLAPLRSYVMPHQRSPRRFRPCLRPPRP